MPLHRCWLAISLALSLISVCHGQDDPLNRRSPLDKDDAFGPPPNELGSPPNEKVPLESIGRPASEGPDFSERPPVTDDEAELWRARMDSLIEQLGHPELLIREKATRELKVLGVLALDALQVAAKLDNVEIATRAKKLLTEITRLTQFLVDAVDQPIPFAKVVLTFSAQSPPGSNEPPRDIAPRVIGTWSDRFGQIAVPDVDLRTVQCLVRIEHPEYGSGQCLVGWHQAKPNLRFPLVSQKSELWARAVAGTVKLPDGQPVEGAVVKCGSVRTPGDGLIEGAYPRGDAVTDGEGRFWYYLPNVNRRRDRGDIIPENSRFDLTIEKPEDDSYFPVAAKPSNARPASIVMPRPERRHRFRFQTVNNQWLEKPSELRNLHVQLLMADGLERGYVTLKAESLLRGRPVLAGTYHAVYYDQGKPVHFEPLTITADSPEELIFRLPQPITYHGRVVNAATKEPARDALVFGYRSLSRQNLAMLSDEDWHALAKTPPSPPPEDAGVKLLSEHYGIQGLVRTDADGRFELIRASDQEVYGVIAVDRNSVPFRVRVNSLKPDDRQRIHLGEFPLIPAAKVVIRPMADTDRLSASPEWLPADTDQPLWFAPYRAIDRYADRAFEYVHWLKLNERQPVYVPAGVRLQLRLDAPYDDQWAPALVKQMLQLNPQATVEVEDLRFAPSFPATVLVVDSMGRPVEGFAVRRKYETTNTWSVAHNTDQNGQAFFYVYPDSRGQFRVTDLTGPKDVSEAKNLTVDFKVIDAAPIEPFRITVTKEQIAVLRTAK